jgi:TetR/AcrR family transcriptional regulator
MTLTSVPDPGEWKDATANPLPSRERILGAALTAFSSLGFEGASTRQIARDAQVAHQLITHYFANKQVLWEAVVASVFEPFVSAIRTRLDGLEGVEPRTVAKLVMKEFVVSSALRPEVNRILLQESKAGGDRMRWLVDTYGTQFRDLMTQMLAPLGVHEGDPMLASVYYALVGAGATVFSAAQECRLLFDIDPFEQGFVESHAERVAGMVLASIDALHDSGPPPRRRNPRVPPSRRHTKHPTNDEKERLT